MGYVSVFACWLVAGTFGVAAVAKLRDLPAFAASIAALGLTSPRRSRAAAVAVVAAELTTTALCVVPYGAAALAGLVLGTGLLGVFGAVAVSSQRASRSVPCRCFGHSAAPLGAQHAVRNAVLAVLAVCGIGALTAGAPPPAAAGWALLGVVSAVSVALVSRTDDLVDLFRSTPLHAQR